VKNMNTENNTSKANTPEYEIDTLTNQRLLKDHEYDGIKELDNDLPPWWKWLFIITIVFAAVYLIRLYIFKADDLIQKSEYNIEMADVKAKAAANPVATFEVVLLTDEASMANGKDTWTKICSVCHLMDGGGLVGPNMTDKYWIHGNKVTDLFNTVTNGVLDKGMISYKDQLSPKQRLEAVSYILNKIQGTTPATPKAPQGTLYE
jgi:cytochrome c oxidase cbb3-type subunit 3